jgi:hypothetical protein
MSRLRSALAAAPSSFARVRPITAVVKFEKLLLQGCLTSSSGWSVLGTGRIFGREGCCSGLVSISMAECIHSTMQ